MGDVNYTGSIKKEETESKKKKTKKIMGDK